MKIALVSPYSLFCRDYSQSEDPRLNEIIRQKGPQFRAYSTSLSLLTLAALTPKEHELVYMDDQYSNVDTFGDFDLVAISLLTASADRGYDIADKFRRRGIHVVIGGTHATLCPEDTLKHADTIVIGDAEDVWEKFLSDFLDKRPEKYYNGGRADLGKSPPPQIDLLPRKWHFRNFMQKEMYNIRTSSGCTRACKFCSNWNKPGCNTFQKKSLEQVEKELEQIASFSDNYNLLVADDNLLLDQDHAMEVVELVGRYNVKWHCPIDVSVADNSKLLKLMRKSGCSMLCLGLESLDERNLEWLAPWKARQINTYREGIRKIRDEGINVMGSFMVGMDFDDRSTFKKYFDFFIETKLSSIAVSIPIPLPGTQFRTKLISEGNLNTKAPWTLYTGFNMLYEHPTLSKKEIYDGITWFMERCETPDVTEHLKKVHIAHAEI